MLSKKDISYVVKSIMDEIVPEVNDRTWIVEYLYRHKIGNKLPRGKKFDFYRGVERSGAWLDLIKISNFKITNSRYSDRVSPFLLSQITLLSYANVMSECVLRTDVVLDVIKVLEGDGGVTSSAQLLKRDVKFNGAGLFKGYEHSHVSLLPNSYLKMLAKPSVQKIIANHIATNSLEINLDEIDSAVNNIDVDKAGRMTGHWLITRTVNGSRYYLGVFPHSRGVSLDDRWIYDAVIESERYLNYRVVSNRSKKYQLHSALQACAERA